MVGLSFGALADQPLSSPQFYKVCSPEIHYCASVDPQNGIRVYKLDNQFEKKAAYVINGWHRSLFLSDDGEYAAIGYPGLDLVNRNATADTVILTILKRGKKVHKITLGQILSSMEVLKKTASHYKWGENKGFYH